MPSEPQHKLKSFIRNSLTFNVMKHSSGAGNAAISAARTDAETTPTQPKPEIKSLQLEDNRRSVPNPTCPSSPPMPPRVSVSPNLPAEHVSMASQRQTKKRNDDRDHRSHSHPFRRHSNGLPVNEAPDNDRNKPSAEKQNLSEMDLLAEFDRLRKEIEILKKTVHDQRKVIKKQSKRHEELKNEVATNIAALMDRDLELAGRDEELQKMKDNFGKVESCISSLETTLQCQVCIELLHRPYALSPCGHVFCLLCLQEWFRKAPAGDHDDIEDFDNPRYILRRPKSCPCCRTNITHRPIPLFVLRGATHALASSRAQLLGLDGRPENPIADADGDPWKGIFPSSEDEEQYASDNDDESSSHSGGADSLVESDDRISDHFTHYSDDFGGYGFESGSGSEHASDAPYLGEEGSDEEDIYVQPRWQPASRFVGFFNNTDDGSQESNGRTVSLLRRGCTLQMILSFHMTYTREDGIIAHVPSLDPTSFLDDGSMDIESMNRVFLGWNIQVDEEHDKFGCTFMQQMLTELLEFPERWELNPRISAIGRGIAAYDVTRLVKLSEIEEYDSDLVSYLEGVELD